MKVKKREGGCESRGVVVESERWSTLKGGNKTGGGMTVSVLPFLPLQGHWDNRIKKTRTTVSYFINNYLRF